MPPTFQPGDRVSFRIDSGWRLAVEGRSASGVVVRTDSDPWGDSVVVRLDAPSRVGNPEWPPTEVVVVSPFDLSPEVPF